MFSYYLSGLRLYYNKTQRIKHIFLLFWNLINQKCIWIYLWTISATFWPETTALSIVAGKLVLVQSPARNKFFHCVCESGRSWFSADVWANVARFSRMILYKGHSLFSSPMTLATSFHIIFDISMSDFFANSLAALIVTE